MSIKFEKNNDQYWFESENLKIEFSNPSVQEHDEYGYAKNYKSILYYYYTVKGFIKDKNKWRNIFTVNTYDFPNIITFKEMLDFIIDNKIDLEKCQKLELMNNNIQYINYMDTGSLSEDYYAITYSFEKETNRRKNERFDITIGKPVTNLSQEKITLTFNQLTKKELKTIAKCVNEFIDYTIDKSHEKIIDRNKESLSSWKSENGKLYRMIPDTESVESVFTTGDKIDSAIILIGDINSTDFHSNEINDFIIESITEDSIIFNEGIEVRTIKINTLLELYDEVYHKLSYNETQITSDFISILSDSEKEEFKSQSIEPLYEKWKEAIINRTWMCREEHKLPKRVSNRGGHENVYASVKIIVKNIKEQLSK